MKKLTYTNDQQIINDAAQMLLEIHLNWSGSTEGMPSEDCKNVRGQVISAWLEANFNGESWAALSDVEQGFEQEAATALYKKAAQLADRKWEAAMTLLGLAA